MLPGTLFKKTFIKPGVLGAADSWAAVVGSGRARGDLRKRTDVVWRLGGLPEADQTAAGGLCHCPPGLRGRRDGMETPQTGSWIIRAVRVSRRCRSNEICQRPATPQHPRNPASRVREVYRRPEDPEKREDFGKPWGKSTRRTNMALFSGLWKVAIAKGWATLNIVDRLEKVGKIGRVKLIYPNETTLNMMAAVMENDKTKSVLAPIALGFFGCMRPEEITSEKPKMNDLPVERWFGWKDIDLENKLVHSFGGRCKNRG